MWFLSSLALAYETDQLTHRSAPLADITDAANVVAEQFLALAAHKTNTETRCRAGDEVTRAVLAQNIAALTARSYYVKERKLAGFGYGAYAAWLETGPIDRRSFLDRDDIYGGLTPEESPVLGTVGTCSTVKLAGVLVGTDKPDHFWALGYQYALISDWGRHHSAAVRWGTFTEQTFYGLLTSNVFSYADLAANEAGFHFYNRLLTPASELQRDVNGCVQRVRAFDWREWVTEDWDEVWNPSVYNRTVETSVQGRLEKHADLYCEDYRQWRDAYLQRLPEVLEEKPAYVAASAPDHVDVFQLEQLCRGL